MKQVLRFLLLISFIVGLSGCWDRPVTLYLFGPAKSCFDKGQRGECLNLKVYDKVELKVFPDKQEVVYIKKGLGLDDSNTVFRKLENCKVIDRENFSCDGLVRTNGGFTNSQSFGDLKVSTSYWTFAFSYYTGSQIKRGPLEFFHNQDSWLHPVIIILAIFLILGILGAMGNS